jgi:hypothetical protein
MTTVNESNGFVNRRSPVQIRALAPLPSGNFQRVATRERQLSVKVSVDRLGLVYIPSLRPAMAGPAARQKTARPFLILL